MGGTNAQSPVSKEPLPGQPNLHPAGLTPPAHPRMHENFRVTRVGWRRPIELVEWALGMGGPGSRADEISDLAPGGELGHHSFDRAGRPFVLVRVGAVSRGGGGGGLSDADNEAVSQQNSQEETRSNRSQVESGESERPLERGTFALRSSAGAIRSSAGTNTSLSRENNRPGPRQKLMEISGDWRRRPFRLAASQASQTSSRRSQFRRSRERSMRSIRMPSWGRLGPGPARDGVR